MVWVAAMDKPSTLASSCRQGRGLDANRVTVMVVLATRRRLAPCWSADEQSQRPSHSCTRRVRLLWIHPTFQCQCELKKLGRAVQLLNSNVACSRIFLVSQSLTSWHRACSAQSAVALNTNLGHWIDA